MIYVTMCREKHEVVYFICYFGDCLSSRGTYSHHKILSRMVQIQWAPAHPHIPLISHHLQRKCLQFVSQECHAWWHIRFTNSYAFARCWHKWFLVWCRQINVKRVFPSGINKFGTIQRHVYMWLPQRFSILRSGQNDAILQNIFKSIFLNETLYTLTRLSLKCVPKGPTDSQVLTQAMAWRGAGDKPLQNQWWPRRMTPRGVTMPKNLTQYLSDYHLIIT